MTACIILKCPCCGRSFEYPILEYERLIRRTGRYVPLFCTSECEMRFSR